MITIHGKGGQHATDIQKRGLFEKTHKQHHAVVVPIASTRYKIASLLEEWVHSEDIVNLAGVMSTSPNGTHNLHFLFGPNAVGDLSVATAGHISEPGRIILDNAENQGIRIIETSREEHDTKMAIIQWLAHFLLVFIGETQHANIIREALIDQWKTPSNTVQDMIFHNTPTEFIIREFFDKLWKNGNDPLKTFSHIVDLHVSHHDIMKFSTPNFKRIMNILESAIQISVTHEYVAHFRSMFKKRGFQFVWEQIQSIRS